MKDLGYCNTWKVYGKVLNRWVQVQDLTPDIVKNCNHRTIDVNLDKSNRGHDTLTTCEKCGYCYHTDSSD